MILKTLIILILFSIRLDASEYARYNKVKKFDQYFSKYSKRFFGPQFNWRYFKAQAIAESRLKESATSRAGAKGIMQIMPRTFDEIRSKNAYIKGSMEDPRWNIAAGIYYNKEIWNKWKPKRTVLDKINFMFGSYNAGRRNIIKAQNKAEARGLDPDRWSSIENTLPTVTGRRSRQTIGYVSKINNIVGVLE